MLPWEADLPTLLGTMNSLAPSGEDLRRRGVSTSRKPGPSTELNWVQDALVRGRTVGMERLSDETRDMASLSDILCQRTPAEIKMPEASPELVIDL